MKTGVTAKRKIRWYKLNNKPHWMLVLYEALHKLFKNNGGHCLTCMDQLSDVCTCRLNKPKDFVPFLLYFKKGTQRKFCWIEWSTHRLPWFVKSNTKTCLSYKNLCYSHDNSYHISINNATKRCTEKTDVRTVSKATHLCLSGLPLLKF